MSGREIAPSSVAHLLKYLVVVAALLDLGETAKARRVVAGLVYALENQARIGRLPHSLAEIPAKGANSAPQNTRGFEK